MCACKILPIRSLAYNKDTPREELGHCWELRIFFEYCILFGVQVIGDLGKSNRSTKESKCASRNRCSTIAL